MKKTIPVFAFAPSVELPAGIALDSKERVLHVINNNGDTIVRLNVSKKP